MKKYKIKVTNLYGLSETGPSHFDDPSRDGNQVALDFLKVQ